MAEPKLGRRPPDFRFVSSRNVLKRPTGARLRLGHDRNETRAGARRPGRPPDSAALLPRLLLLRLVVRGLVGPTRPGPEHNPRAPALPGPGRPAAGRPGGR